MQYIDLCRLVNGSKFVEHLTLKNLKINSFREDGEVGKVQKEKKQSSYLVLLFTVTFILQKPITKTKVLPNWKALINFLSHNFVILKLQIEIYFAITYKKM